MAKSFFDTTICRKLKEGGKVSKLLFEGGLVRNFAHIRMAHGVITHDMPFTDHPPHQIGIPFNVIANQEEGSRGIVLLECVQDLFRAAVFVAGIEGQIDHFFVCVAKISGVVFL